MLLTILGNKMQLAIGAVNDSYKPPPPPISIHLYTQKRPSLSCISPIGQLCWYLHPSHPHFGGDFKWGKHQKCFEIEIEFKNAIESIKG